MELDVEALHRRLEARAKAMIALEEQEVATRTKVRSTEHLSSMQVPCAPHSTHSTHTHLFP